MILLTDFIISTEPDKEFNLVNGMKLQLDNKADQKALIKLKFTTHITEVKGTKFIVGLLFCKKSV